MEAKFIVVMDSEGNEHLVNLAHVAFVQSCDDGQFDKMYLNISDTEGTPIVLYLQEPAYAVIDEINNIQKGQIEQNV